MIGCIWRVTRVRNLSWQQGFLVSCLAFAAYDILVSQCNVAFLIGYLIPRSVRKQLLGARSQAITAARRFWREYRDEKFVSPENMNTSILAPNMDLYQQAEEEDKTELEVLEERGGAAKAA